MLTMYNIGILGDFDRDVFASHFTALLFVGYTFFVVVINLNVLIAIVSDSYGARVWGIGGIFASLSCGVFTRRQRGDSLTPALFALAARTRRGARAERSKESR